MLFWKSLKLPTMPALHHMLGKCLFVAACISGQWFPTNRGVATPKWVAEE